MRNVLAPTSYPFQRSCLVAMFCYCTVVQCYVIFCPYPRHPTISVLFSCLPAPYLTPPSTLSMLPCPSRLDGVVRAKTENTPITTSPVISHCRYVKRHHARSRTKLSC
jgi:hypothetical protein